MMMIPSDASFLSSQELTASLAQLQESYKQLQTLFSQSEQALATVGARLDGVKEKVSKTPTVGGAPAAP